MANGSKRRSSKKADRLNGYITPVPTRRSQGWAVIRWIEFNCVYTNGKWIGQQTQLLRWQKLFILALFAVGADGRRLYRWALLGIPKKNGKTELAAWLALYFAIGSGEPAPLVVCAAASDEQADLVFGAAKTCAELSPTLSLITDCYDKEILIPSIPGAKIQRVAAAKGTNDGKNIYVVICDELHQWVDRKSRDVWTILTNGVGSREEPMVLQITTAGSDLDTVCGEQYTLGRATVEDPTVDPAFFFTWYEAPDEINCNHDPEIADDEHEGCWRDPEVWKACNPSWGRTLPRPLQYLRDQMRQKTQWEFWRYFLNKWTEAIESFVEPEWWARCVDVEVGLNPALPAHVAIDVGLKHDSCAISISQVLESGRVVSRAEVWENPYPPNHRLRESWRFDIAAAEAHCRDLKTKFPRPAVEIDDRLKPGPAFYYDPHFFERSAQLLDGEGLAMVEYPQTDPRMVPASQMLYQLIKEGTLAVDDDDRLRRHVFAAIPKETQRGWRIVKPKGSRKHIDAAITLAMSTYKAHQRAKETKAKPKPGFHVLP